MNKYRELFRQYNLLWSEANVIYEAYAASKGLTYTAFLVVLSLTEAEGTITQNDIASMWQLPKQTVFSILEGFRRQGYVTLVQSEGDKRAKDILLTADGKSVLLPITEEIRSIEARAGERLGEEKLSKLIELSAEVNRLVASEMEAAR